MKCVYIYIRNVTIYVFKYLSQKMDGIINIYHMYIYNNEPGINFAKY